MSIAEYLRAEEGGAVNEKGMARDGGIDVREDAHQADLETR